MIGGILSGIGSIFGAGVGLYDSIENTKNQQAQLDEQKRLNDWTMNFNERTFQQNQANWDKSFTQNQANIDRAFNYQADLNKIIMDREDKAVQRRMADLQSAGLSKWAGLGTSAQTASLSSAGSGGSVGSAGHSNTGGLNAGKAVQQDFSKAIMAGMNIANAVQGMQSRAIENELKKAEILKSVADVANVNADTKNKGEQYHNIKADTKNKGQQFNESVSRTFKTDIETDTLLYNLEHSILSGIRTSDSIDSRVNSVVQLGNKMFDSLFRIFGKGTQESVRQKYRRGN